MLAVLAGKVTVFDLGLDVIAVHERNEVEADLLWTGLVAFSVVRARAKEVFHGVDHVLGALPALCLTLRKQVEVVDLGCGKELSCRVRARCDAGATTNARRRVHSLVGSFFGNWREVGIWC